MLHQVLNVMIQIVNYLVINPISIIFIYKFVMPWIKLVNIVYFLVKLIIISTPALVNMCKLELHDIARHDFVARRSAGKP